VRFTRNSILKPLDFAGTLKCTLLPSMSASRMRELARMPRPFHGESTATR
jgi:hypothetical protein